MEKIILLLGAKKDIYKSFYQRIEKKYGCKIITITYEKNRSRNNLVIRKEKELEDIKKFAQDKQVIGVVNKSDAFEILHGKLVDYFKVAGPSYRSIRFFKDKVRLHKRIVSNNLAFYRPRTLVSRLEDLGKDLKIVQFPVVIKPFAGAKSRGVFKLSDMNEFEEIHKQLQEHFEKEKSMAVRESKHKKLLIEEYIKGKVISFECFVDGLGKLHSIFYTDVVTAQDLKKEHMQHIYRTTPSKKNEFVRKRVEFLVNRLIKISKVKSSCLHPEFFVVGNKVYLIEMNVRMGGYRDSLARMAYGISLEKIAFKLALGEEIKTDFKFIKSATACEVWEEKSGIIEKIKTSKTKAIKNMLVRFEKGQEYLAPPYGNMPVAYFLVQTEEESLKIAKKVRGRIIVKCL